MKFKKLFDESFILEVSKDKEKLLEVVKSDYGFVFKQMERFNIKVEKEIVVDLIKDYPNAAAIIYLFNHFPLTSKEKGSYGKYFKSSSSISESLKGATTIDTETILDILTDDSKNFIDFDYTLTASDFKEFNIDYSRLNLEYSKKEYIEKCILNMDVSDVLNLPSDFIVRFPKVMNKFYEELFDIESIRDAVIDKIKAGNSESLSIDATEELVKKTLNPMAFWCANEISIKSNASVLQLIEASKKYFPDLPFIDSYRFFRKECKAIVLTDFVDSVDIKDIENLYIKNKEKFQDDLGYGFERVTMLPRLNDYIKVSKLLSRDDVLSVERFTDLVNIVGKHKNIDFTQFSSNSVEQAVRHNLKIIDGKENGTPLRSSSGKESKPEFTKELIIDFYKNWWISGINSNVSYIADIPSSIVNVVTGKIPNSLQKMFLLSRTNEKYFQEKKVLLSVGLDPALTKDLIDLIEDKEISIHSPLFKEETFFKLNAKNMFDYRIVNFLPESMMEKIIDNDLLHIRDSFWRKEKQNIGAEYRLSNSQEKYIMKNINNPEMGKYFKDFVDTYKKNAIEAKQFFPELDVKKSLIDVSRDFYKRFSVFEQENKEFITVYHNRENYGYGSDDDEDDAPVDKLSQEFIYKQLLQEKSLLKAEFKEMSYEEVLNVAKLFNPQSAKELSFVSHVFFVRQNNYEKHENKYLENTYKEDPNKLFDVLNDCSKDEIKNLINFSQVIGFIPDDRKVEFTKLAISKYMINDVFESINFDSSDKFNKELKNLMITEYPDYIVKDSYRLGKKYPEFNIDDYIQLFSTLEKKSGFYFSSNVNSHLGNFLELAIKNTDEEIFWSRVEDMKVENPAIYTLMLEPTVLKNVVLYEKKKSFLSDRLELFTEEYFERFPERRFKMEYGGSLEQVKVDVESFIYDYIDVDVVARGLNQIRNSLLDKVIDDYKHSDYSENYPNDEKLFPFFRMLSDTYSRSTAENLYIEKDKLNELVNNLLDLDLANTYLLNSCARVVKDLDRDDLINGILRRFEDVEDITKLLMGGTTFNGDEVLKVPFPDYYFQDSNGKPVSNLMSDTLDALVHQDMNVGVFMNFISDLKLTSKRHFNYNFEERVPDVVSKVVGFSQIGFWGLDSCAKAYDIKIGLNKSEFYNLPLDENTEKEDNSNSFKL